MTNIHYVVIVYYFYLIFKDFDHEIYISRSFRVLLTYKSREFKKNARLDLLDNSPTEGRPTNLARSRMSSWSSVFCVAGKNVNFYVKKSNQVAASGRSNHAKKNVSFVWH